MDSEKLNKVREQADALGITYHHKAGADTIQKAINAYLERTDESNLPPIDPIYETKQNGPPPYEEPQTEYEFQQGQKAVESKLAGSLVRCTIQNMNPLKKAWNGEFISVGSAKLGTFKKFIPFNSGEPYHVPRIIYNELKAKKCSTFYNVKDEKGNTRRKSKLINEYVIDELEPLTTQELKDLALKQAMAQGKEG